MIDRQFLKVALRASELQMLLETCTFFFILFTQCIHFVNPGCTSQKMRHVNEPSHTPRLQAVMSDTQMHSISLVKDEQLL